MSPRDDDEIMVFYPHGGPHLLLHYRIRTDNNDNGGHLVLARTEAQVECVVQRVLSQTANFEVKSYNKIDIVSAPPWVEKERAAYLYRQRVEEFLHNVSMTALGVLHSGGTLPPPLVICHKYSGDEWSEDNNEHHGCSNCILTITLDGTTPEALYAEKHELYEAIEARKIAQWNNRNRFGQKYKRPDVKYKRPDVVSRAPKAVDGEQLFAALAGSMSEGSHIEEVSPIEDQSHAPTICYSQLLFTFRCGAELDTEPLRVMAENAKAAQMAKKLAADETRRIRFEKTAADDAAWLNELFCVQK